MTVYSSSSQRRCGKLKLILVEHYDKEVVQDIRGGMDKYQVIALTPEAVWGCFLDGIPYDIPSDYYVWREDSRHKVWLRGWLHLFNHELRAEREDLRTLDMPITFHFVTILKNIMDAYVKRYRELNYMIGSWPADEIYYLAGVDSLVDELDPELYFKGTSLYARFFANPLYDRKMAKKRFLVPVEPKLKYYRQKRKMVLRPPTPNRLRAIVDYVRSLGFFPAWRNNKPVLFADVMPKIMRHVALMGYQWDVPVFNSDIELPKDEMKLDQSLFDDIAEYLTCDWKLAHSILHTRLLTFANATVPTCMALVPKFVESFLRQDPSCIIFNRRNKIYHYAALIAARKVGVPTVYIRHGWDAYDSYWRRFSRFQPFDYFVCGVDQDRYFYRQKVEQWKVRTNVI